MMGHFEICAGNDANCSPSTFPESVARKQRTAGDKQQAMISRGNL
jgi:hypothetical protein